MSEHDCMKAAGEKKTKKKNQIRVINQELRKKKTSDRSASRRLFNDTSTPEIKQLAQHLISRKSRRDGVSSATGKAGHSI